MCLIEAYGLTEAYIIFNFWSELKSSYFDWVEIYYFP